ncbi:MAG: two-component regulator propeller domain-containing protein, partial [Anaerolineales bacterium]|nr:two-component regulator propeller domain-containing protein [Anaerolineales bacterium]
INALAIDNDGRIWAATTSGLAVFSGGKWFAFSSSEYPWYQGWLDNVAIDSQNRVWVTSNDVLSVYNGTEAILFTPDIIGESLWDNAIGFDKDGCVWVGMSLGLTVFQGKLDLAPGNYEFIK